MVDRMYNRLDELQNLNTSSNINQTDAYKDICAIYCKHFVFGNVTWDFFDSWGVYMRLSDSYQKYYLNTRDFKYIIDKAKLDIADYRMKN